MNSSGSMAGRALLAVALMVGFYVLALGISAVLLYLPYAEVVYAHRIHPKLALICLVGAGTILWSIVPRPDRFRAPGPALEAARHPRLFEEIGGVARATGQAMPAEVFLVGDVNAWVAQRGGVMGFFSRRVMGIGLPLLQALSVSEFRAVVAHEFGHYHGGDTRLGPWVYKTRSAIGRTIGGLGDSMLQKPFLWYGTLFLRISHAVSRRQEFSADGLAARIVGSRPLVGGLQKAQVAAPAYSAYWSQEVAPVLQAGYLPPLADGFRRFASQQRITQAMSGALEKGLQETAPDPYDTHPPLAERIRGVAGLPPGPDPSTEPAAISLLRDVDDLERRWLATVADPSTIGNLQPLGWESVVSAVLLPAWRGAVVKHAASLRGATIGELATHVAQCRAAVERLPHGDHRDARAAFDLWLAATATTLALDRAGWTIEAPPGAPVSARRDDTALVPFEIVQRLANGSLSGDEWRAEAARLGVSGLSLTG